MQRAMKNAGYDTSLSDIPELTQILMSHSSASTHRAWQELPRKLRRRAASHDVRRVPARLRGKARAEVSRRLADHDILDHTFDYFIVAPDGSNAPQDTGKKASQAWQSTAGESCRCIRTTTKFVVLYMPGSMALCCTDEIVSQRIRNGWSRTCGTLNVCTWRICGVIDWSVHFVVTPFISSSW